jgi:hypothetical protein
MLLGAVLVLGPAHAQQSVTTASPTPLASLGNLPPKIASANVRDSSGAIVGAVQRVELSDAGMPTRVDVALIGKKDHIVSLDPAGLTYDAANNEILAQSSAAQMRALPHRG